MTGVWLVFDDVPTGHHPGYLDRVVAALLEAGIRPIVAAPVRPPSLGHRSDWIETAVHPLRAVLANRKQFRRVVDEAQSMGADTLVDLFLDKNVWAAGSSLPVRRRVHVLHHAGQYDQETRRGLAGLRTRVLRARLRRLTESGAHVVVHTPRAREIVAGAVAPNRLIVAGYPVPAPARRLAGAPSDPPTLLFTGAGRSEKGLDNLIAALAEVTSEVELRVVGAQPDDVKRRLIGVPGPVTWVDRRVSDEELWEEYNRAALAVLPYRDSFGIHGGPSSVLLEIVGRGIPLVTTPALASQLPAGRGHVVAESDAPGHLAVAIDDALSRYQQLAVEALESGPNFVAENHSYQNYARVLIDAARGG